MQQINMPRIAHVILLAALGLGVAYAANPESLTKYILQVDSFGPITVGMTPNDASKKLGTPLALAGPPDEDTNGCHYVYPNGKFDEVGFMVEGGRITRIDIYWEPLKIRFFHPVYGATNVSRGSANA